MSQQICKEMDVFPGHQKTVIWENNTHRETFEQLNGNASYSTLGFLMSDHGGTHVDAFNHFDPSREAKSIDEIALSNFITRGICLDVSFLKSSELIDASSIKNTLFTNNLEIKKNDTVLLYTDYHNRENRLSYPGLNRSGVEFLADMGVVNIGIDTPSIDSFYIKGFPAHMACVDRDILNMENLVNLASIVNSTFKFIGLPLKIKGGTGAPIRAIAIFE